MTDAVSEAQDVLDQMTRQVVEGKSAAQTKLTPVGTEAMPPLAGVFPATFPNDEPAEVIVAAVREVRRQLAIIDEAMFEAERVAVGEAVAREHAGEAWHREPAIRPAEVQKSQEQRADERAAAIKKRLRGEEQKDAAFVNPMVEIAKASMSQEDERFDGHQLTGWVCPVHGDDDILNNISKRGRAYRQCGSCKEFEK